MQTLLKEKNMRFRKFPHLLLFLKIYPFTFRERERERENKRKGLRERERESQANSTLSTGPMQEDLKTPSQDLRPQPKLKARVRRSKDCTTRAAPHLL